MKFFACFLVILSMAMSRAFSGPVTYTGGKADKPVLPVTDQMRDCFAPGLAFGIYGSAILDHEDAAGGGVLAEYFLSRHIGLQASYGLFATDGEHHEFDAALVLRYPIQSLSIAPYVMAGGGLGTNSSSEGNVFVGAGLEGRLDETSCLGIFADGAYHWADGDAPDYTIVRLGVKFPF